MPSQSTSRRRRRSAPPPRLSWPGDLLAGDTTTHKSQPTGNTTASSNSVNADENKHKRNSNSQATTNAKASHKKKRQRTLLPALTNASSSKDGTVDMNGGSLMWVDKYAPTTRQELCIAPKKVNEVAAWLDHHTIMNNGNNKKHNHAYNNADHDKKLLILVGRPGIGKSTMMRVLAAESNLDILEWNDSYSAYSHQLESLTPLNSFAQFLQQGGVGFTSLDVQESTAVSSFSALEASLSSPTKSQNETLSTDNNTHPTTSRGGLILLEELPHLHNSESQERFCDLLTNHVQHSHVPTVWIYSEGSEGQHKPADLERHIRPDILYRHAKILQINPITTTKVKQCLERIAKAQGNSFQVTKDFCERLQLQSGGDIRYAINALQFDQSLCSNSNSIDNATTLKLKGKKRGSKKTAAPEAASTEHTRDTQFTAFHALGKLLYAKREPVTALSSLSSNSQDAKERPPLNFVPEQVLEQCDMDLGHALTYLEYHCADFFTDVEELSTALELYSDASYLLEQTTNFSYQRRHRQHQHTTMVSCPIFPEGYVTSLTGRAVAHANRHPAPSRFRSLQAPKVLEIRRKRNDNAYHLERLQHRLSMLSMAEISGNNNSSRKMVSSAAQSSLPSFVMDQLPFMRTIVPNDVNASLDQLHTSGSESADQWMDKQKEEEEAAALLEKVQEEILKVDDIDEFDSDNEDEKYIEFSQQTTVKSIGGSNTLSQQSKPPVKRMHALTESLVTSGGNPTRVPTAVTQVPRPLKAVKIIANPYKAKPTKPVVAKFTNQNNTTTSENGGVLNIQDTKTQVAPIRPAFNNPYANKKAASKPLMNKQPKMETEQAQKPLPKPDDDNPGRKVIGNRVLMDV